MKAIFAHDEQSLNQALRATGPTDVTIFCAKTDARMDDIIEKARETQPNILVSQNYCPTRAENDYTLCELTGILCLSSALSVGLNEGALPAEHPLMGDPLDIDYVELAHYRRHLKLEPRHYSCYMVLPVLRFFMHETVHSQFLRCHGEKPWNAMADCIKQYMPYLESRLKHVEDSFGLCCFNIARLKVKTFLAYGRLMSDFDHTMMRYHEDVYRLPRMMGYLGERFTNVALQALTSDEVPWAASLCLPNSTDHYTKIGHAYVYDPSAT